MKVLFFIRSMVVGGSQRQLAMLARGLQRRGHDVAVVVFYTGSEIGAVRQDSGLRLISLGKTGRWDALGPLVRLRRLLVQERPDIVYAFQPTQSALAALLLPARQAPKLVFGVRAASVEFDRYDSLSALTYRLEAWLSRRADLIIANAQAVRADAIKRGMPPGRVAAVPNGIDVQAMQPDSGAGRAQRRAWGISDDAFVIGCVARFDPMKDHATFLAAAAEFGREHPDARFVCVGDGAATYRNGIKALAASLGLDRCLVWAGEMDDLRGAYNAFDVATLSSAFGEGFPNVIGEAMACGIPVAATDVGDSRLIVGEFGEVVAPRRPDLLASAWSRLRQRSARDASFRDAMRQSIVAGYGVDAMVDRTAGLLAQLLADRRPEEITGELA